MNKFQENQYIGTYLCNINCDMDKEVQPANSALKHNNTVKKYTQAV